MRVAANHGTYAAQRFAAQLLAGPPATDALSVVRRLLAVQAQDGRGARLALRARSRGVGIADIEHALTEERSLLISWLNRGTLHLVATEDYAWLHSLTTPQLATGTMHRLAQEGINADHAERGVAEVCRALADGPLGRRQLHDQLQSRGIRTEGQAFIQLIALCSQRGLTVRGPMAGRQHAYVLTHDWLPPQPVIGREQALAELARRFLLGHSPATARDLAKWAGVTLGTARSALRSIGSELKEMDGEQVMLRTQGTATALPPPRLLGSFEPVLMGWTSREWVLGADQSAIVQGGMFLPFLLVKGRLAGRWRVEGRRPVLQPFGELSAGDASALRADAGAAAAFLFPGTIEE